MASHYFGAILLNVTSLQLAIVNLKTHQDVTRVTSNVALGENIYSHEPIPYSTVMEAADALKGFLQQLKDYDVTHFKLWGSNALSTAVNANLVADQLFVRTGMHVHWLSTGEEAYYRNIAVAEQTNGYLYFNKKPTVLLSLTSGNTNVSLFKHGQYEFSRNMKLGPLRIEDVLHDLQATAPNPVEVLADYINHVVEDFSRFMAFKDKKHRVVLIGAGPVNQFFMAPQEELQEISVKKFSQFAKMVRESSDQYLMDYLKLDDQRVQMVLPETLLIARLLEFVEADSITLTRANVLDGLLINATLKRAKRRPYLKQVITAATNFSDRYRVDPAHRDIVTGFALHLFDQLKPIHQLPERDRLLLHVAALDHDVGEFIDDDEHYVHSEYILSQVELIGLSTEEIQTIASVSRYHSSQTPTNHPEAFNLLPPKKRIEIAKLAAILRIADALDDDGLQKIKKISVSIQDPKLIITAESDDEIALNRWVFNSKAKFFSEVYGLIPVLKQRRLHK
ncbi:Ppx/GppA phosphatase family protein [Levilactobacillus bambusae]|uniref:Exopolyphosphatase n=1 Tax=Levilactobacillus bambusae TaxID=2024736 RepID=A0A2V1MZE9_9LACO|nr:HD domain-containing protein [Levilactobacillus bambusae]PWF99469.1 exopolyphosphatase [Levilactobacillus bambusae]